MAKKMKIGIVGLGYVGGAIRHWFRKSKKSAAIFLYDKYKKIGSIEEVNFADVVFVAVPTPFNENRGGYDDSAVREAVSKIKDGKTVIIKSTVVPGSTDWFQKKYPKKTFLFNPEFLRGLRTKTILKDFMRPDRQIVGFTNARSRKIASRVLQILPKAPFMKIVKALEAEMVKYFANTFLATRVIFANQIYDLCQKLGGIDYDTVKECAGEDPRIGRSHFDIFTDGYRGFGGPCLPKDLKALLQVARSKNLELPLLETVDKVNAELIRKRKIK
jgi:UDPglucose 6-dehydrogenase